jgi:hypothetical protein
MRPWRPSRMKNPTLKGVLPKSTYGRADLDKRLLGEVIDLVGKIELLASDENGGAQDVLGRVYEYFIGQFAAAEGKKGGQFYTPTCIVELLVRMIEAVGERALKKVGHCGRFMPAADDFPCPNCQPNVPEKRLSGRSARQSRRPDDSAIG